MKEDQFESCLGVLFKVCILPVAVVAVLFLAVIVYTGDFVKWVFVDGDK